MGLYLGENEPTNIYLGDTELSAIYLGDTLIWQNGALYELPNNSEGLPMIQQSTRNIVSVGRSADPFVAEVPMRGSNDEKQVFYSTNDDAIGISLYSKIWHSIENLSEWSVVFKFKPVDGSSDFTPIWETSYGKGFMNSYDQTFDVWTYDKYDNILHIRLRSSIDNTALYDSSGTFATWGNDNAADTVMLYNTGVSWLANNGAGRTFKVGLKDGIIYFYIDSQLIASNKYDAINFPISKISVGSIVVDGVYLTPRLVIKEFKIYDSFIFDIPAAPNPYYDLDVGGYIGGSQMPSIGTINTPFDIGETASSSDSYIGYNDEKLYLTEYGYIQHTIPSNLNIWVASIRFKVYDMSARSSGGEYRRFINNAASQLEFFIATTENKSYVVFGSNTSNVYLEATGAYGGTVENDRNDRIALPDLNESFFEEYHTYKFVKMANYIRFYVDDVLVGTQTYQIQVSTIRIGTHDSWNNARTPGMYIEHFKIYDEFGYTIS